MPKLLDREERNAKMAQRALEGAEAMREYLADQDATRARTARLREERLARESLPPAAAPTPAKKRTRKKAA